MQTSPANPDLGVIPASSSPLEAALRAETSVPVRDIPDLLAAMSDRGASRLTVSLSPEGLGRVQLSVASSPQGLVVTVMGAQSALEMLSRTEIVMVLAARGMQVTSVDLVVQGNSASSSSPDDQSRPGSSTTDHGDAPGQQRRSRDNESEDPYAFWS